VVLGLLVERGGNPPSDRVEVESFPTDLRKFDDLKFIHVSKTSKFLWDGSVDSFRYTRIMFIYIHIHVLFTHDDTTCVYGLKFIFLHTQTIGPYYDHIDKKDGQKHIDTDGLGPGSDWSMPDSERHPSDLTFSEVWRKRPGRSEKVGRLVVVKCGF